MTGTPAERAAQLSARIHRGLNHGGIASDNDTWTLFEFGEFREGWDSFHYYGSPPFSFDDRPFARLGAELRAIVLGNREGRR